MTGLYRKTYQIANTALLVQAVVTTLAWLLTVCWTVWVTVTNPRDLDAIVELVLLFPTHVVFITSLLFTLATRRHLSAGSKRPLIWAGYYIFSLACLLFGGFFFEVVIHDFSLIVGRADFMHGLLFHYGSGLKPSALLSMILFGPCPLVVFLYRRIMSKAG